jgi:hypothetical protein
MNNPTTTSRRSRILRYLLLLGTIVAAVAIAQTDKEKRNPKLLIDGSQDPDQVPEWLLWNELFRIAAAQKDKSSHDAEAILFDKLQLPQSVLAHLVQHGLEHQALRDSTKSESKQIIANSRNEQNKDRTRVKLHKNHAYLESRTLEIRDKLRSRIGDEAFLKLHSYARLQIAPVVKVYSY